MSLVLVASLLLLIAPAQAPAPPRDRPAPGRADAQLERSLRSEIATGRAPEEAYSQLSQLLHERGETDAAETVDLQWREKFPSSVRAQTAAAAVFNRRGDFENCIAALRAVADLQPQSAEARHRIAVFLWDKSRGDNRLDPATRLSYIMQGIELENQALALVPDYMEALTYKNILLRLQANQTADRTEQARLIAEADELRNRVIAMMRQRETAQRSSPQPATDLPFSGSDEPFDQAVARLSPVRVGGEIRVPPKIRDVRPRYPIEAERAHVQGVVIIEALVDESGAVANARVVRSVPLLDAAALVCVRQWVFAPTLVNGRAVPVLMTVTVNFVLQPAQ